MIKGYLGDICFNGKLLKNHIIYIDSEGKIEKIIPFSYECEGIILCDQTIAVIKSEVANSPQSIARLKENYNNSDTYYSFFKTPSYIEYRTTEAKGASFIELGDTKPLSKEENKRDEIINSKSYKSVVLLSKIMDKYYLDPIIGLFPIIGDIIPLLCSIPAIYVAFVKIKSLPLILAIIYNIIFDATIGMIPFLIGNIVDFYNKAYIKNLKLIVGFINDDKYIIKEVNRKATLFAILIAVVIIASIYMIKLTIYLSLIIKDYIASIL